LLHLAHQPGFADPPSPEEAYDPFKASLSRSTGKEFSEEGQFLFPSHELLLLPGP
jgi:hypothetical protein